MSNWVDDLNKIIADHDGVFGHNCYVTFKAMKRYLKRLENKCYPSFQYKEGNHTPLCDISIVNYYTITITLPLGNQNMREELLLKILTDDYRPSDCRYNRAKHKLTLEWHY